MEVCTASTSVCGCMWVCDEMCVKVQADCCLTQPIRAKCDNTYASVTKGQSETVCVCDLISLCHLIYEIGVFFLFVCSCMHVCV